MFITININKLFKSSHNLIPEYIAPENKISAHIASESASSQSEAKGYASSEEHSFGTELARENSEVKQNLFVYNEPDVLELNEDLKEEKVEREQVAKVTGTNKDEGPSVKGPVRRTDKKIYPNDLCPCGSGKKYKNCCGRQA